MSWEYPDLPMKTAILSELQGIDPVYSFTPETMEVAILDLPFYNDALLLRVTPRNARGQPLWYVRLADETVALDGSAANLNYIDHIDFPEPGSEAYAKFRAAFSKSPLPEKFEL